MAVTTCMLDSKLLRDDGGNHVSDGNRFLSLVCAATLLHWSLDLRGQHSFGPMTECEIGHPRERDSECERKENE